MIEHVVRDTFPSRTYEITEDGIHDSKMSTYNFDWKRLKRHDRAMLQVSRETHHEFQKAFRLCGNNVTLEFDFEYLKDIPAAMSKIDPDFGRRIKRVAFRWAFADAGQGHEKIAATMLASLRGLEELYIEIDWLRFRKVFSDRLKVEHWVTCTAGIQELVRSCPKLRIVKVSSSATFRGKSPWERFLDAAVRERTRQCLENYLNKRCKCLPTVLHINVSLHSNSESLHYRNR